MRKGRVVQCLYASPRHNGARFVSTARTDSITCMVRDPLIREVWATGGLFSVLAQTPTPFTHPETPQCQVPHADMTLRHYLTTFRLEQDTLNRSLPASDALFLQDQVFDLIPTLTIRELMKDRAAMAELFRQVRNEAGECVAQRAWTLLRRIERSLVSSSLLPTTVLEHAYKPIHRGLAARAISHELRAQIIECAHDDTQFVPVALIMETGASCLEVCSLERRDIQRGGTWMRIRAPDDARRLAREIPLSKAAKELVAPLVAGDSPPDTPLFLTRRGTRLSVGALRRRTAVLRRHIGCTWLTERTLIRAFEVAAIRNNIDPVILKDYMGYRLPHTVNALWESIPRA